jgi:integrase
MARAGVVGSLIREKTGTAGRNLNGLSFHSLRHTCISAMANAGVDQELRMEIVGQETDAIHKGYTHHERERLRSAISAIPGIL